MEDSINIADAVATDENSQLSSIIRVIGVGGAGCNAVNNMFEVGIEGVNYIVCNTDLQALNNSKVPNKVQLGKELTGGLGAGNNPEKGEKSAIEAIDSINEVLEGAKMVFVTAGMGGGTGTGAAPVIAKAAKEKGILTVGVVSIPYRTEGKPRIRQAIRGVENMAKCVDSLIIVNSDRLRDLYEDLPLEDALNEVNRVLTLATKGLAEIITVHAVINVDYADLYTAMHDSGVAVIGVGEAEGDSRAIESVTKALDSPLLNNSDIKGSKYIVVNIFSSRDRKLTQKEQGIILDHLREISGVDDDVDEESLIWGNGYDDSLGDKVRVTIVATGFATEVIKQPGKPDEIITVVISENGIEETNEPSSAADDSNNVPQKQPDDIDKKMQALYEGSTTSPKNSEVMYSTKLLADPKPLKLSDLKDESVISNIEQVPAYKRRGGI